jgi:cell division protein FtsZ
MANKGLSLMGTGVCSGPDRAIKAATEAISSPLLEDISIDGATGIIINITGNDTLTMHETNEAVTLIMEAADDEAEIIFGTVIDGEMTDEIKVTVIATGLGGQERVKSNLSIDRKDVPSIIEREEPVNYGNQIEEIEPTYKQQNTGFYDNLETPVNETLERASFENRKEETREQNFKMPENTHENLTPNKKEVSSLVQNIKEAATRYEVSKKGPEPLKQTHQEVLEKAPNLKDRKEFFPKKSPGKVVKGKSIAEKLGFINFNEEELDTPSFMRKDKNVEESNIQR